MEQFGANPVKVDNFWEFLNQNIAGMTIFGLIGMFVFAIFILPQLCDFFKKD